MFQEILVNWGHVLLMLGVCLAIVAGVAIVVCFALGIICLISMWLDSIKSKQVQAFAIVGLAIAMTFFGAIWMTLEGPQ